MLTGAAPAKVNLALVVGPRRRDGKHEVVTVAEKLALADTIGLATAEHLTVDGFDDDTLVRAALRSLAERVGVKPAFAATIDKRIPVASGLGGGSSDAATALRLANELLGEPLTAPALVEVAALLGADVPLFLQPGPVVGTGDGTTVVPVELPRDYHVVLWLPDGATKASTADVYRRFDAVGGDAGFPERRAALESRLRDVHRAADLAALPANDLASSPYVRALLELGAFRADVSGAGPTLYGLFGDAAQAGAAAGALRARGRVWLTTPTTDA